MFGSIFIGLSGMNAYSAGLKQISNNITNLNSLGYKSSDASFVNLFGTGSSIGNGGQGVTLTAPRLDFSQGEMRQTDRSLDLAIEGDGFLVLLRDTQTYYARTGSFEVNEDGEIVLAGTDYKLTVMDENGAPTPISLNAHQTNPPQATTTVKLSDNLSSTATSYDLPNIQVYSAEGSADAWRVHFERSTATVGEWNVVVTNSAGTQVGTQTLRFISGVIDPATSQLTFQDSAGGRSVTFDFSQGVSSFSSGSVSSLRVVSANGYGAGQLTSSGVNADGDFELTYSNGQKKTLGSVAMALFQNPQFLEQRRNGLFGYDGSLPPELVTSARAEAGKVVSGQLESSNVDLAQEFGNLILVQRGFQASSQVVSVSNDMIQQLFGIRGQG
jgi:flagellar hook protein FlgE